jgi:hypothetical protein
MVRGMAFHHVLGIGRPRRFHAESHFPSAALNDESPPIDPVGIRISANLFVDILGFVAIV